MQEAEKLILIITESGKLKEVERTGWVIRDIENSESVADHTWRMNLLIMLLAPKNLDMEKLLKMSTVHDLPEIQTGDIITRKGRKVLSSKEEKNKKEVKAIKHIFSDSEKENEVVSLVTEYVEQKTPEAKFLKQVDKLEMAFQALKYQKEYPNVNFNEFWENAEMYLGGKELESIFRKLQEMRKKL